MYFLKTECNPVGDETDARKQRNGTIIEVPKVPVVNSYNTKMGY